MNDLLTELIAKFGVFGIVIGLALALIRRHTAGARTTEADANTAESISDSTERLFSHYNKELADLREIVHKQGLELSRTEKEVGQLRHMYKASAAGEKRYREAFAELLRSYAFLIALARGNIDNDKIVHVESEVTNLIAKLSMPLDWEYHDDKTRTNH